MATKICPICKSDEKIQKITSVVSSNISRVKYSGLSLGTTKDRDGLGLTTINTTLAGSLRSNLAEKLLPPKEPARRGYEDSVEALEPIKFSTLGLIIGAAMPFFTDLEFKMQLSIAFSLLAIGIFSFFLFDILIKRSRKWQLKKREDRILSWEEWKKAIEKYNTLYYCFRDDVVFEPSTADYCAPDELMNFIYSDLKKN